MKNYGDIDLVNVGKGINFLDPTAAQDAVTLAYLQGLQATEIQKGIAQVATQVETDAGVIDTDMVTPLKLKNYVATILSGNTFSQTIGDTILSVFTITHNLGTKDLVHSLRLTATDEVVYATVTFPTVNTAVVTFALVPTLNQFRITIKK